MPITQPTIDDFSDTTVMRVIRKVVNYLVTLIPKVNEEIANVTDSAGERLDTVEANVEALNKELPTDIRVNYTPSTGNFNIDYVKEDGDVLTSNTVVIVSGTTGEVTIVQNTSGISINGTALQSATTAQPGLMTPALVSSLNNVNDTTNDHTTMLNAQAEAITALDDRVDALEQGGSSGGPTITQITSGAQLLEKARSCKLGDRIVASMIEDRDSNQLRYVNVSAFQNLQNYNPISFTGVMHLHMPDEEGIFVGEVDADLINITNSGNILNLLKYGRVSNTMKLQMDISNATFLNCYFIEY